MMLSFGTRVGGIIKLILNITDFLCILFSAAPKHSLITVLAQRFVLDDHFN